MTSEKNLLRQIFIINQIRGFGYITLKELEDQLYENGHHNSVNTMKRDFEALCKMGYIIKYNYQQKGYCIVSNSELTKHIDRYAEEFELYLALNSVQGFSDFVYPEFRRPGAIAKMRPFLNAIRSMKYIQFLYQKYSNRNTGFLVTDPSHSENVFESLGGNTESLRVVAPYFLKEFRGLWYLICKDDKDKQIKSFALDRISDVKDVGLSFNKDESFNLIKKYRNCFGIYCPKEDSKPEEVILSFDAENGRYLKANPLHHSQKILMDTEEEFRISLFLYITLDFLQEILTRTWSLRIISPESLRETVCKAWKEAIERNA